MKLENLERVTQIEEQKRKIKKLHSNISNTSLERISFVNLLYRSCSGVATVETIDLVDFDRDHLAHFLDSEIQALNLELHNLGVELPGVPTIGQGQAITKGHDR